MLCIAGLINLKNICYKFRTFLFKHYLFIYFFFRFKFFCYEVYKDYEIFNFCDTFIDRERIYVYVAYIVKRWIYM